MPYLESLAQKPRLTEKTKMAEFEDVDLDSEDEDMILIACAAVVAEEEEEQERRLSRVLSRS